MEENRSNPVSHGKEKAPRHMAPEKVEPTGSFMKSLIIDIIIAIILASIVLFFIRPTVVKQSSMENTLHENDYMIMYRQAYRTHTPERGDIIIFQSHRVDEDGDEKLLVKRIIGLPGDKITIADGMVYINDEEYPEDYLKDGFTPAREVPEEGESITVPDGSYFAMGDNRVDSLDSRTKEIGFVKASQIQGKIVLRLFPFNKIRRF